MSAPIAYSHVPTPEKPKVAKLCRLGIHRWQDIYKLTEHNNFGEVVDIAVSQRCRKCFKIRVIHLRPGVPYPQYYPGFYRYA